MSRSTIDFGIDLGTTNSSIAVAEGVGARVIDSADNLRYTPSAVALDRYGRLIVGRGARQRVEEDPGNAFAEFKLHMGTDRRFRFERSGREVSPEELSAEVLKKLRADAGLKAGEEPRAAVITVPADFDLPECEATRKAARLAGIEFSPLLQEPVAAATAYGFQSQSEKAFWLVYDFGGGTFDAAVIQVRDGTIQVVNHGGDKNLGGKLIDWAIVERVLIPAITRQYHLPDLHRGNPAWRGLLATLKVQAEQAKIVLSRDEAVTVEVQKVGKDAREDDIEFWYDLKREEVERLAEPFFARSISICRQVLAEKRLRPESIDRIILVGGPTMTPFLRHWLPDATEGLGIRFDPNDRVDPLTVVAEGAAIFAATQRLSEAPPSHQSTGAFTISLPSWPFAGPDEQPTVVGRVTGDRPLPPDCTVEVANTTAGAQPWRSGRIAVTENGAFMTTLWAERGKPNTYVMELRDGRGTTCPAVTAPAQLSYTMGMAIADPPLTHNIGVTRADGTVQWVFRKGQSLPARAKHTFQTVYEVRRGYGDTFLRAWVVEGSSARADRNRRVGLIEVLGDAQVVTRDVPYGSDIEVTLEVDVSRQVSGHAYIPVLDADLPVVELRPKESSIDREEMLEALQEEQERLSRLEGQVLEVDVPEAREQLQSIDEEDLIGEVQAAIGAGNEEGKAAIEGLQKLQTRLDNVEADLLWPSTLNAAEEAIGSGRDTLERFGNADDGRLFAAQENQVRQAMASRDVQALKQATESLRNVVFRLLDQAGVLPVWYFEVLCERSGEMEDQARARWLISQGQRAVAAGDTGRLRATNRQLAGMLPDPPPAPAGSTVM